MDGDYVVNFFLLWMRVGYATVARGWVARPLIHDDIYKEWS